MWITILFLWITIGLFYLVLLLFYVLAWLNENSREDQLKAYKPKDFVTVVVPARNEASNIKSCLISICQQNYPQFLYEIILVDDFSEDDTVNIAESLNISNLRIIKLADHFKSHDEITAHKKTAIAKAIEQGKGTFIITTDADCIVPSNWLHSMIGFMETKDFVFVTGPVYFEPNKTLLQKILALDFCGMMVTTGASVFSGLSNMSNGANLTYRRSAFYEVEGFKGIDHVASGDDLLLMEKMSNHFGKARVGFLKSTEASVQTLPPEDFKAFVNQRIRWTSKSTAYQDTKIKTILTLVWLSVFFLCLSGLLSIFFPSFRKVFFIQLGLKMLADFILLYTGTRFFRQRQLLWLFLPAEIFHTLYILLIGFLGNFKKYEWKGRTVK